MASKKLIEESKRVLRDHMWENRSEILDFLLLHDCGMERVAAAGIISVDWEPEQFVLAALADDRTYLGG